MSKSSKSPNQAKSSSSVGSMCPPTARSPSMMTAEALTDPNQIPTALPNSVNTAIGLSRSDMESNSGMSDTSAGSGRLSSIATTPVTAKAPTSPELIMNDLRRGSLFGRQSKSQGSETQEQPRHPPSYTNITFSNITTNMSTASQMSTFDDKPLELNQVSLKSETTDSVRTGIPPTGKSAQRGRSANSAALKSRKRSPADKMNALKKQEEKQRQLDQAATKDLSKKSKKSKKMMKSKKSAKSSKKMASTKSRKGAKAPGDIAFPPNKSPKSKKSLKSKKVVLPPLGQSGADKKGDNVNNQPKNTSVYLPGVMDNPTPAANKFMKKADTGKSTKSARKFNEIPAYNFPGAGKCTRNMEQVAPPTPKANNDQSHCVYDVAQLPAAQRRFQPKREGCSGARRPRTLFDTKKSMASTGRRPKAAAIPAIPKEAIAPKEAPAATKIVVLGKTPDGKNTIQMTIDMQIVAGEALNGSDQPIQVIPQKVMVGGKTIALDGNPSVESKRGAPPP